MIKRISLKVSPHSSYALRRALRTACALLLALICTHYFSKTQTFWLALVTLLLTQGEPAFPLRQGLERFFWILVLLMVFSAILRTLHSLWPVSFILITAITVTAYPYACRSGRYLGLHFSLLLMVSLVLLLFMPALLSDTAYLWDILMGAALGLLATLFVFPDKADLEFPKKVTPLLKDLAGYLTCLVDLLLREPESELHAQVSRSLVEKIWINKDKYFPVWVFEAGFNPALKAGQYYFVVHLGQITEILFAMHHFARHPFPADLLAKLASPLQGSVVPTQELFKNLILMLEGKKTLPAQGDFIEDLRALEENFHAEIKLSLELLDISRDYVYLAAFIRYLKDLRLQLLQLIETLTV